MLPAIEQNLSNKDFVGIGLSLLDGRMSYAQLVTVAVDTTVFKELAGANNSSVTNAQFVNLVYSNLVGVQPSLDELTYFVGLLDGAEYTQASLALLACEAPINAINIDLVGLASTGIEFIPYPGG